MKRRLKALIAATDAAGTPSPSPVAGGDGNAGTSSSEPFLAQDGASADRRAGAQRKRPVATIGDGGETTSASLVRHVSRVGGPEAPPSSTISEGSTSTAAAPAARHTANLAAAAASPTASATTASTPIDLSALLVRCVAMLLGEGEHPFASGIPAIASEPTYALVLAVRDVVGKLWEDQQGDIKAACAPLLIDEVDVLAYVIADALGRPLLHPDDTNAVGKRVESCAALSVHLAPAAASLRCRLLIT